jgi:hypothetical protein
MENINKRIIIEFVGVFFVIVVSWLGMVSVVGKTVEEALNRVPVPVGAFGSEAKACTMATSTLMVIGKDIPAFVAATSSRRATLVIQPVSTSTLALNFNGAVASSTTNSGQFYGAQVATGGSSSTSTPVYKAGLATDNPYVGAISAINLFGTSTALVTECVYTN